MMKENLTPRQRLERIAQIINKGIYLLALKEEWFDDCSVKNTKDKRILSQRQDVIMAQIESKGRITNKETCKLLGISRDTVHRELKGLLNMGLLKAVGKGRAVTYFEK